MTNTENYERPRLNLERWNSLRLAVESKGMRGWYEWAGLPGGLLPSWEVRALEEIGQDENLPVRRGWNLRRAIADVLDPNSKVSWPMTKDEAQSALALLDAGVSGAVTKEQAHQRWTLNVDCMLETGRLHAPGKVFKAEDFKGGACSPLTWVYVLRAHFRKVPRIHLRCTLDEQAAMMEAALREAPTLFAGLFSVEPSGATAEEASHPQA